MRRSGIVLPGILGAVFTLAAPAGAGVVVVEFEEFFAAGNSGGAVIEVKACAAASGRLAVDGLDRDGEWIQVRFELPYACCVVDSLRSAGAVGLVRSYAMSIAPESPTVPADGDTVTTLPGRGVT